MKRLFTILAGLLCAGIVCANAQDEDNVRFNPEYSIQDISVEYGRIASFNGGAMDSNYLQVNYSRLFWRQFAFRAGAMAVKDPGGFEWLAGAPLAVSYRPWTVSLEDAVAYTLQETLYDTVYDSLSGRSDQIGSDILFNLFWLLFRRFELIVGVTPALYLGNASPASNVNTYGRFALIGDAGVKFSIPIWRFSLDITPQAHYSFLRNTELDGEPTRLMMSASFGISYLF
ncbi:MAG: hypothetical protein J6W94_06440 [Bacteroidales bacterium]|nr:hypothetical protein [Bacteroidales bacterium]MBP5676630.1 hypothetical protein [Bacteroidales bacterium]